MLCSTACLNKHTSVFSNSPHNNNIIIMCWQNNLHACVVDLSGSAEDYYYVK